MSFSIHWVVEAALLLLLLFLFFVAVGSLLLFVFRPHRAKQAAKEVTALAATPEGHDLEKLAEAVGKAIVAQGRSGASVNLPNDPLLTDTLALIQHREQFGKAVEKVQQVVEEAKAIAAPKAA